MTEADKRQIEERFDEKFPLPVDDCELPKSERIQDGHWLEYGKLCTHDDFILCAFRMQVIKDFIFQLLEEQEVKLKAELREKLRMEYEVIEVGQGEEDIKWGWNNAVAEHNRLLNEELGGEDGNL